MKNTLQTRLGLFFALALVAGAIVLEMIGGLEVLKGGLELQARFNNIQDLKAGDPVKMAGVPIGRVKRIDFAGDKVLVLMKITDPKATVRTDSKATVKFLGLMGQNYVALDFGTAKGAKALAHAELETLEQPEFAALMGKLEGVASGIKKLTDSFSETSLNDLILPFTDFLKESRPRIMAILTNAEAVSAQVASGKGTVGRMIYEESLHATALNTITNLNDAATDIRAAVADARAVVAEVNAGRGSLGKLTKDDRLYEETAEAAKSLKEILQKINQGQGSVGKLLHDESLFKNAKLTLQKLDKATDGLEDQGPLSILGMAVNKLF